MAELHLHLYGSIRSADLLRHLAGRDTILWDEYESRIEAAFGVAPPTREIVERHRNGHDVADEFDELFVFGDPDGGNFDRFSAKFQLLVVGSTIQDLGEVAGIQQEVAGFAAGIRADHIANGVSYAEQRLMLDADLRSPRDRAVIDTLLEAYSAADSRVTERLAMSLHRSDPWAGWERVQELALGPHGSMITGIDFCNVEEGHPPKEKAAFFAAVKDFNAAHPERALAILYHVGESFREKSLESAVRWVQEAAELGAHRLGHAIALGIDPDVYGPHTRQESVAERRDQIAYDLEHRHGLRAVGVEIEVAGLEAEVSELATLPADALITIDYDDARLSQVRLRQDYAMSRVRATGAVVEVCPTSNRRIGGIDDPRHHPVHRFIAHDLRVVVASDDPGIFGTTLNDELDWVCTQTGGGDELRDRLIANAWDSRSEVLSGRTATAP